MESRREAKNDVRDELLSVLPSGLLPIAHTLRPADVVSRAAQPAQESAIVIVISAPHLVSLTSSAGNMTSCCTRMVETARLPSRLDFVEGDPARDTDHCANYGVQR